MERNAVTPSLQVADMAASLTFYTQRLGFEVTGSWDDHGETVWAEVSRDTPQGRAVLWFFTHPIPDRPTPVFSGLIYLFLGDVDALAAQLAEHVTPRWGPETQDYGLREFGFEDPDGYLVCLAEDVPHGCVG